MSNIDDFTARDIFFEDAEGNTLYKRDGKIYLFNDLALQKELRDIEGYRSFLLPRTLRAIIILPTMFLSAIVLWLLHLFGIDVDAFYGLVFYLSFFALYGYAKYSHHSKIMGVLKRCEIKKDYKKPPITKEFKAPRPPVKDSPIQEPTIIKKPKVVSKKGYSYTQREPFGERFRRAIPDLNLFHIVMFLLIASPFLFFIYAMLKAVFLEENSI